MKKKTNREIRLLVAKELVHALEEVDLNEAVKEVLPCMEKLAADTDDTVKETFASELDQTLLYFYKVGPLLIIRAILFWLLFVVKSFSSFSLLRIFPPCFPVVMIQ